MARVTKRTMYATTAALGIALIAMFCLPTIAASTQADYLYALNEQNRVMDDALAGGTVQGAWDGTTITLNAWGFAFQKVSEDTIKKYNCTTEIIVVVHPAAEDSKCTFDVSGTVVIDGSPYAITEGKAFLAREKKMIYLNCTGTDDSGNDITLKLSGHYFWWGGKAFALRTKAVMQTEGGPMLLLERAIAKVS